MVGFFSAIVYCYAGCASGSPDEEAINVLKCDTESGKIEIVQTIRGLQGTTYFQVDRRRNRLYTVHSCEEAGKKCSKAVAFEIGRDHLLGRKTELALLPCEAPCHVAFSPDFERAAFAAYSSATVGILPAEGGEARSFVLPDVGMGNYPGRQKKAYAHFAFFTPDGSRLGTIDLGCDRIHFFDSATMGRDESMTVLTDRGDGPRHAVWSNDRKFLFVLNELSNTVISYAFEQGGFRRIGKWSTMPEGSTDWSKASAIKLTADGKILMASNRGYDSIAFFAVDGASGNLSLRNIAKLNGPFPRDFELMPGEKFMVVGHERGNEIQVYRFDRGNCTLEAAGKPVKSWMPLCFKF